MDTLLNNADTILNNFQRDLDRKSVYHSLINTMWHIIRHCWHIIRHWCHGIMGKGWWTNLHPWLPSKQIPHHVSKLTHKWNKSMILSQVFTNMHICWVGPRFHGTMRCACDPGFTEPWVRVDGTIYQKSSCSSGSSFLSKSLWKLPNNMLKIAY